MEKFIKEKVTSESAKKAYITLFKRIEEFEDLHNKKIEKWNKNDCINFLSNIGSKKYNTVAVKWSLLKKYLFYIGNNVYREITKGDLEDIENNSLKYISMDRLIKAIEIFENNIDKALLLMIRSGIKGEEFCELSNLKVNDIKGNIVSLSDRKITLDDFVTNIVDKAKNEKGYRMNVKKSEEEGKRIAYSYYGYNNESEFFWKNRPNKYNHDGLDAMKSNASKVKINNLINRLEDEDISATSLTLSYVVDEILKVEKSLGIKFTEVQTKAFIEKLGTKCSMYAVYTIKNELQ